MSKGTEAAANYYVDNVDGISDAMICGSCVKQHGLRDDQPASPESFAASYLKCAIHVGGDSPANYEKRAEVVR